MKQNELYDAIEINAKSILKDIEELKTKEEKIRKDERERIIKELEEFAKNPCGEGKYCKHSYDDIGCEKCVALKVIEIVRGEENERD